VTTEPPKQTLTGGVGALRATAQPLQVVMSKLVSLWRPQLKLNRGEKICRQLSRQALECYKSTGTWDDLRKMDRPAILTLSLDTGETQYVLLRRIDGDSAVLDSSGLPLTMSLEQLDALWRGEFLLIWPRETDETSIGPQTRGYPIMWLRQRLAQAENRKPPVPISDRWDAGLREAVRRFQLAQGLDAVGLVGTRTLIALSSIGHLPNTPTLQASTTSAP
jgi:general secretion pathway protein A